MEDPVLHTEMAVQAYTSIRSTKLMGAVMKPTMSSKERILRTIEHEEPDHVPLYNRLWDRNFLQDPAKPWRDQFDMVEQILKLGIDQGMEFVAPRNRLNPEVETRVWKEQVPGEQYPLLHKEWTTPKGTLTRIVRQTWDWPHGDDIPLFGDYLVPRSVKFLIETVEDARVFDTLFVKPTQEELDNCFAQVEIMRRFCEEHEILLESHRSSSVIGADIFPWVCGVENTIRHVYTNPSLIRAVLETVHRWDVYTIHVLAKAGADIVFHRGWYEGTSFWTPTNFRRFLLPNLKEEASLVHQLGGKFCYINTLGIMPILKMIEESGADILYGIDPVQGGPDLDQKKIKDEIGDHVCLWGGVNGQITLDQGSKAQIEEEVLNAVRDMGERGGFILSPVDHIYSTTPWRNIETMIKAWRRIADYPLKPE